MLNIIKIHVLKILSKIQIIINFEILLIFYKISLNFYYFLLNQIKMDFINHLLFFLLLIFLYF